MMQQPNSMEARLEALERRCRRLTVTVVGLTAILATACLSSAMRDVPEVLRAKRIEILREDGEPGVVMAGGFQVSDGSASGAGIWLFGGDHGSSSGWTAGRIRDEDDGTWRQSGEFYIETDTSSNEADSSLRLQATGGRGTVQVQGGPERAELEAGAKRTSLRFRDIDPNAEEDEEDPLRVSLELVDGVPALRALSPGGEPAFEQR